MAGNTSTARARPSCRVPLGAARRLRRATTAAEADRAGPAGRAAVGHRAPAGRRAGRGGALARHRAGDVRRRAGGCGTSGCSPPCRPGLRQVASPFLHDLYGADPGHRAPRRPRRHRACSTSTGSPVTRPCPSSARSARGCRCTRPASARCCWPYAPPDVQAAVLADLPRVTRVHDHPAGLLAAQLRRVRRTATPRPSRR